MTPSPPTALQQLVSLLPQTVQCERLPFVAGQVVLCPPGDWPGLVVPEQGVLVLQQAIGERWPDAVVLGACDTLVMSGPPAVPCRLLAVTDGWAQALRLPPEALSHAGQWLLQRQSRQQHKASLWAYCRHQHALPQRLATWMCLLDASSAPWSWAAWVDRLNTQPAFLGAALQALASAGAVRLEGEQVGPGDAAALRRQACNCLPGLQCITPPD